MVNKVNTVLATLIIALVCVNLSFAQVPEVKVAAEDTTKKEDDDQEEDSKKKTPKGKPFEDIIEDYQSIEGLFNLYYKADENKVFLEIKPGQFGKVYLCNITRVSGEGYLFDSGAMLNEFPFFFKKVGKQVQMIEKNVNFRADKDEAIYAAVERGISNSLFASVKITGLPHPEKGSVLVDASDLFIKDVGEVNYLSGQANMSYAFDKGNSYFSQLKSFPLNTEIEVTLHFKSSKPRPLFTLANSQSMQHRYHYSLSTIPETDYEPRPADDRVGHFHSMHQDYNALLRDDPYQRYVRRWNLKKAEPKFDVSKPEKPIVFWLENTIPVEYREAVSEGVLLWNDAFEKIGFKGAIEVRQMSDDAEWDPADVRYNTIRWIVQPGAAYAVGPSRANPYTGQIYDADIRISADFVRFYYTDFEEFVTPSSWKEASIEQFLPGLAPSKNLNPQQIPYQCQFAQGMRHQIAFGWNLLLAQGKMEQNSEELKQFIHEGVVSLVAHEVGHTLGLRHNFKASSIHDLDQLQNQSFTRKEGLTGSVMDYIPVNVSPKGKEQGQYFQTTLGAYDYWVIEYAYKPFAEDSEQSKKKMLEEIASRGSKPELRYGTDEDAFGFSTRSIDPTCNLFDMGRNPLEYFQLRLNLTRALWDNLLAKFEKDGERYQKLRSVFSQGITEYAIAGMTVSKFIGGIYYHRDHIGNPGDRPPMEIVAAETQRQALDFLAEKFFLPNSFQFSPELLNKLAPERHWDFEGTVFRMQRLDYPIHGIVQVLQALTLFRLYDPLLLARLQDNEIRFPEDETPFTMAEMFATLRDAIWEELAERQNINSFRRELQRMHLNVLTQLVVGTPPGYPHDAATLGHNDLLTIQAQIEETLNNQDLNTYSRAHLRETLGKIEAALSAQMQRRF